MMCYLLIIIYIYYFFHVPFFLFCTFFSFCLLILALYGMSLCWSCVLFTCLAMQENLVFTMNQNLNVPLLSFNVNFKRNSIFNWLKSNYKDYFIFLQETHFTTAVANIWEKEQGSKHFFSHGFTYKCDVAILTPPNIDFKVIDTIRDNEGQFLKISIEINDTLFYFINIYAPIKDHKPEQNKFLEFLLHHLTDICDENVMVGEILILPLTQNQIRKGGIVSSTQRKEKT